MVLSTNDSGYSQWSHVSSRLAYPSEGGEGETQGGGECNGKKLADEYLNLLSGKKILINELVN